MSDRPRYLPLADEPDDGTNGHFPIAVTIDGLGPAEPEMAHYTTCWCSEPECMLFYGDDRIGAR